MNRRPHTSDCVWMTNLPNKGLISADRRAKPTLMLTIPRSLFKSSTSDLSLSIFVIVIRPTRRARVSPDAACVAVYDARSRRTYRYSFNIERGEYRRFPAWILT